MLEIDLHVHSLFSNCGLHTILELIEQAKCQGMKGIAVTDHGPSLGGRLNSPFFDRFRYSDDTFVFYKGIEANVIDAQGTIDIPFEYISNCDVVLLGLHHNVQKGMSASGYTDMLINAIERNPCVDMITHPNDTTYPIDYVKLCSAAALHGVAIELNNSRTLYRRSSDETTIGMINACVETGCRLVVASDTHAIQELGDDSAVSPLLARTQFPKDLLVTLNAGTVNRFLLERKKNKAV